MATTLNALLILSILLSIYVSSDAQSCSNYTFTNNQLFTACIDLPYLNAFLHWNYHQSTKSVKLAYRSKGESSSRWVAWGINPKGQGMVGTQALVAFQKSDGNMRVYTSPVDSYSTQLQQRDLSFPVSDLTATCNGKEIIVFATLKLDENISSTVNHVWQQGPVSGDSPGMHRVSGGNVKSLGTLNLSSGESRTNTGAGGVNSKTRKKNIHGVLNTVSWGIMMPIGALFARYLKVFPSADPAWFYLHAACQTSAYIVGVAGWATGLRLGTKSPGVQHTSHRNIGIILFCLATLQVFALFLRPKKDHKYRYYWSLYHQLVGHSVIILSIINIFKGFHILDPDKKWRTAYIGFLIGLGIVAATLEAYTWYVVLKRNKSKKNANGTNNNYHRGVTALEIV